MPDGKGGSCHLSPGWRSTSSRRLTSYTTNPNSKRLKVSTSEPSPLVKEARFEYDLSYPKHEFLRFLVEFKGLLMHGSNNADIDVMNPVRFSTDAGAPGNVSGVYAAKDHLQPMFFAIVNRRRCFGVTNGFVDRKEDGAFTRGEEEVGVHSRFYYLSIDYKGLLRDPWCSGTVYILQPETFTFWGGQYTSRVPVKPLMKIAIHPEDHPLLSEIWGYEYHGTMRSMVHRDDNDPYHFLEEVDIFPIHPSGKPFSVWLPEFPHEIRRGHDRLWQLAIQ